MSVALPTAPLFDDDYFRPPDDFTWADPVKDEYPTGYGDDGVGDEDELEAFLDSVSEFDHGNFGYSGEDYPSISHLWDD